MSLPSAIVKQIADAVKAFEKDRSKFEADAANLQNRLLSDPQLKVLIHSSKWRIKESSHLHDKLTRRANDAIEKNLAFDITAENIFDKIHDLAGVRLLHLHMRQLEKIHPLIMGILQTEGYVLKGKKQEAKTWDPEYADMLKRLGIKVTQNQSLYTSVHYIIKQNRTTSRLCELQVRTLAEEIWGEVSHMINYPHETDSVACKEQLKVLARLVSGCSRLVDSIIKSYDDHCTHAAS